MIRDYFPLVIKNFSRRPLRGGLTIIGILIGITAVVALISLSYGLQNAVMEQFEKLGTNRITVSAGGVNMGPAGSEMSTAMLSDKDIKTIEKVGGVEKVVGILMQTGRVDYNEETKYLSIFGATVDSESRKIIDDLSFMQIDRGRSIRDTDTYSADVGFRIATDAFDKEVKVGSKIEIAGKEFEVVGTRKKAGTGIHDGIIKIPIDAAREIFSEPVKISEIMVLTKEGANTGEIAAKIEKELRQERDVKEGEEDFTVQTIEQIIGTFKQIIAIVQVVLIGIAAVSLLIGGIGIMNTMYTSVLERTKEIGIMKALGARSQQIMLLFLIESGFLGLTGGIIGIFLGLGIGKIAQYAAAYYGVNLIPSLSLSIIFAVLLFSFSIGAISGVFPAMQASRLRPIDAIRRK